MDTSFHLLPEQAANHATSVDRLTLFVLLVSAFFTLLIAVLVVYFAIHYRRRVSGQHTPPQPPEEHAGHGMALEITWTVIPIVIVTVMFLAGAKVFIRIREAPKDAMEIYVMGKRW